MHIAFEVTQYLRTSTSLLYVTMNAIKTVGFQVLKLEEVNSIYEMLEHTSDHITSRVGHYDELSIRVKQVHNTPQGHPVNEIIVNLIKGTPIAHTKVEDRDVLAGMDRALDTIKNTVART